METRRCGSSCRARFQSFHPGPALMVARPLLACAPPSLSLRFSCFLAMCVRVGEDLSWPFTCSSFKSQHNISSRRPFETP